MSKFTGKKILVVGFGRSGYAASKVLLKNKAKVVINDVAKTHPEEKIREVKKLGAELILGRTPQDLLDETFDYVVKSPSITNQHVYVKRAKELSIPVINELEIAYYYLKDKVKFILCTGTSGKAVVASIIHNILKNNGYNTHLVTKNESLCDFIDLVEENDIIVGSFSSQQLFNIDDFKPDYLVINNIFETKKNKEFYLNFKEYVNIKRNILKNLEVDDLVVLNYDDEVTRDLEDEIISNIKYFSLTKPVDGAYLDYKSLIYNGEVICTINDIKAKNFFNIECILAAIIICREFNITNADIKNYIAYFKGLPHRLEFVTSISGVEFYNDAISTDIEFTKMALKSFNQPINLIIGGEDSDEFVDYMFLANYCNFVKAIFTFGGISEKVKAFSNKYFIETFLTTDLEDATITAFNNSNYGDVILYSPGCPDDKSYEIRGNNFKKYVNNLR